MKRYSAVIGVVMALAASPVWSGDDMAASKEKTAKAYSLIHISRQQPSVAFPPSALAASKEGFESFVQDQKALIKSRPILRLALADPSVRGLEIVKKADAVRWLEKNLRVDSLVAPTVIRISLTGPRPPELVKLVNAVTKAYLDEVVNRERTRKLERLDTLKGILTGYEQKLSNKRQQLRDLVAAVGKDQGVWATPEARQAHRASLYTEQRDLKREFLRLRLAEAREKVHLERAGDKQETHKRELAVLGAQMNVVREGLAKVDQEINQFDKAPRSVEDVGSDIQRWEETIRKISSEIEALEVERMARDRVQLWQEAELVE
jgi:hypothetical protein